MNAILQHLAQKRSVKERKWSMMCAFGLCTKEPDQRIFIGNKVFCCEYHRGEFIVQNNIIIQHHPNHFRDTTKKGGINETTDTFRD